MEFKINKTSLTNKLSNCVHGSYKKLKNIKSTISQKTSSTIAIVTSAELFGVSILSALTALHLGDVGYATILGGFTALALYDSVRAFKFAYDKVKEDK